MDKVYRRIKFFLINKIEGIKCLSLKFLGKNHDRTYYEDPERDFE